MHACARAQFVAEASATLTRRGRGQPEDVWLKSPLYPEYYLNTFHYQVCLPGAAGSVRSRAALLSMLAVKTALIIYISKRVSQPTAMPAFYRPRGATGMHACMHACKQDKSLLVFHGNPFRGDS
jgi:hypothetical protein